jgi:hypothetical protein
MPFVHRSATNAPDPIDVGRHDAPLRPMGLRGAAAPASRERRHQYPPFATSGRVVVVATHVGADGTASKAPRPSDLAVSSILPRSPN